MSYTSDVSLVTEDFGYPLEFSAQDADENIIALNFLSGASGICFTVWRQTRSGELRMQRTCDSGLFTINNASGGLFEFLVPSGWFNRTGLYEADALIRISGMREVTLTDLRISVVRRSP